MKCVPFRALASQRRALRSHLLVTPCRQHFNTYRKQVRTVVSDFMLDDIVLNLSAGFFGGDITNATWVTAARAESVEGRTTLNFLGKTADPKGEEKNAAACPATSIRG